MIEFVGLAACWDVATRPSVDDPASYVFRQGALRLASEVPLCVDHDRGRVIGEIFDWDECGGAGLVVRARCWDRSVAGWLAAGGRVPLSVGLAGGASFAFDEQVHPRDASRRVRFVSDEVAEVSVVDRGASPGAEVTGWRWL